MTGPGSAAQSRGKAASAWSAVRVPSRKAATKASLWIRATSVMTTILANLPKCASPVQEAEGLLSCIDSIHRILI